MGIRSLRDLVAFIIFVLTIVIFIRTAWISDDAMITLRAVLNFTHGYGPVFNLGERVQAFTHPLWFLFLSLGTYLTSSVYYFTFFSSIAISLFVVILLISWFHTNDAKHWGLLLALILSKSFVDYSTSGLENPLNHLMLVLGFMYGFRFFSTKEKRYALASLIILISTYLCRPDMIILVLPFCIFTLSQLATKKLRWQYGLIAIFPSALWTIFSLIYYGFPFPNTAYAKLGNNISTFELIWHGMIYFRDGLRHDPLTLLMILFGIITSFRSSKWQMKTIGIGVSSYLAYIIWIGGDFMSGRFFTAPFVAALMILGSVKFTYQVRVFQIAIISIAGLFCIKSTVMSGKDYEGSHVISSTGIVDERGYWYQQNGLLSSMNFAFSQPPWETTGVNISRSCEELGELGLKYGPSTYLIDLCGLTDPLLARLPSYNFGGSWRIGHFYRQVPTNYELAILKGDPDTLTDPWAASYWKNIRMVTRGKLFTFDRWKKIIGMNLGMIKKPDFSMYTVDRVPSRAIHISELPARSVNKQREFVTGFYNSIQIDLDEAVSIRNLDISITDSSKRCVIKYEHGGIYYPLSEIDLKPFVYNEIQMKVKVPTPLTKHLRIEPDMDLEKPISRTGILHLYVNSDTKGAAN